MASVSDRRDHPARRKLRALRTRPGGCSAWRSTVRPLIRLPALITGARSDTGPALAITFAAEGAHAAATGRSQQRGTGLIAEIRAAAVRPASLAACPGRCPGGWGLLLRSLRI